MIRKLYIVLLLVLSVSVSNAQQPVSEVLSFAEYMGYVKKYHPVVRQANLQVNSAEAALMAARGAFDPKLEVDFDKKQFKGTEYYSILNSSFKIPTWYGIEVKAGFDNSEGMYINPQNTTPYNGLTSLGISVPVGQGLWINTRMAELRAAKMQLRLSEAQRKLEVTNALYDAAVAYFNWKKVHDEAELYQNYVNTATARFEGIIKLIKAGDKPAIDSVEARITVKSRLLTLEDARLKLAKAKLEVSNYLWIDNTPVELAPAIVPEAGTAATIAGTLGIDATLPSGPVLEEHPKIAALQSKLDILNVERRLKANFLLPKINLTYNYLSEPAYFTEYRLEDYKLGVNFSFPLFLRKERGGLRLAKLKLQDAQFELDFQRVALKNKIEAQHTEIRSVLKQQAIVEDLINDYRKMLESEERLFSVGESSVFLINSRENSLISAQLSRIHTENRYLVSNAQLFNILGLPF